MLQRWISVALVVWATTVPGGVALRHSKAYLARVSFPTPLPLCSFLATFLNNCLTLESGRGRSKCAAAQPLARHPSTPCSAHAKWGIAWQAAGTAECSRAATRRGSQGTGKAAHCMLLLCVFLCLVAHTQLNSDTCIYMRTRARMHTYIYPHTCIHTCMHATYIYMHASTRRKRMEEEHRAPTHPTSSVSLKN